MSTQPEGRGVLVFGGTLSALAVIRSLGRRNIPVAFAGNGHSPARWSRYAKRFFPVSVKSSAVAVERLMDLAERENLHGWRLVPCGDAEVEIVSRAYERLAHAYRPAVQRWETLRYACDDHLMVQRARGLAIPHPVIHAIRSVADARAASFAWPVVAKAARAAGRAAFPRGAARLLQSRDELVALFASLPPGVTPADIAIHEWIPGEQDVHLSYAALWRRGSPVAALVALRTRQGEHGLAAEPSFVEPVEVEEVTTLARRFLRAMSYEGFIELRFKFDARDGQYKLVGAFPRPWSWMPLAAELGVDLSHLFWTDEAAATVQPRAGISWRDTLADARMFLRQVLTLRLSPRRFLNILRQRHVCAVWARDDRRPALARLLIRPAEEWPANPATTIAMGTAVATGVVAATASSSSDAAPLSVAVNQGDAGVAAADVMPVPPSAVAASSSAETASDPAPSSSPLPMISLEPTVFDMPGATSVSDVPPRADPAAGNPDTGVNARPSENLSMPNSLPKDATSDSEAPSEVAPNEGQRHKMALGDAAPSEAAPGNADPSDAAPTPSATPAA